MRRFPCLFTLALAFLIFPVAATPVVPATPRPRPAKDLVPFDLSRIDQQTINAFVKAWRISKCGLSDNEGVVLVYATPTGRYQIKTPNSSNQFRSFTFPWQDDIIAIFHTHPRSVDPRPSLYDMQVADKYQVLVFTLTLQGMYVYDPQLKRTHLVIAGLDWLEAAKWTDELATKMAAVSSSFSSRLITNGSR